MAGRLGSERSSERNEPMASFTAAPTGMLKRLTAGEIPDRRPGRPGPGSSGYAIEPGPGADDKKDAAIRGVRTPKRLDLYKYARRDCN